MAGATFGMSRIAPFTRRTCSPRPSATSYAIFMRRRSSSLSSHARFGLQSTHTAFTLGMPADPAMSTAARWSARRAVRRISAVFWSVDFVCSSASTCLSYRFAPNVMASPVSTAAGPAQESASAPSSESASDSARSDGGLQSAPGSGRSPLAARCAGGLGTASGEADGHRDVNQDMVAQAQRRAAYISGPLLRAQNDYQPDRAPCVCSSARASFC